MIDIVVAHYEANIDWIAKIDKNKYNIILYKKDNNALTIEKTSNGYIIPNYGWESLVYIYHINKYYDKLSDTTIFLQDFPFDHLGNIPNIIFPLFENINTYYNYCYNKKHPNPDLSDDFNIKTAQLSKLFIDFLNNLDINIYDILFFGPQTVLVGHGDQVSLVHKLLNIPQKQSHFNAGSMFLVKKTYIISKSLKFWNTLLHLHSESKNEICSKTLPYVLERSWSDIFNYIER